MADNWIEGLLEAEWFLVENVSKVIRTGTEFPEIYYEAHISTSPHKDKAKAGYRLANLQRWFGPPTYNGEIEAMLGRHIVEAHNAMLRKKETGAGLAAEPFNSDTMIEPAKDVVQQVAEAKAEDIAA